MKKPLIILSGPTAVGKTQSSLILAKELGGEIISADSMQIYKYMNIGTAKILPDEMCNITHHLVDELYPDEEFNVMRFKEMAVNAMKGIYERGHIPIIVGGTGFYIQSVLYDIKFEKEEKSEIRQALEKIASKENGTAILFEQLAMIDPNAAKKLHPNNVKRVIRALEFNKLTGKLMSEHNEEESKKESPYDYLYFVLYDDRNLIYERINKRVDLMVNEGLVEEVKSLLNMGYNKELVSMQGLGYKEIIEYLEGSISLYDAIYKIKRDTRHFAKRQITWFKREPEAIWIKKDKDSILQIIEKVKEKYD
ncbi:MAG: tRNA (adenosine(37)-N6)-dimethylallyltransferase MiaA [Suipraeoptans sp.]